MRDYSKPHFPIKDQIQLLKERGLIIKDEAYAEHLLTNTNYYRLSGYCLPFEKSRHVFKEDITLDDVVSLYEFDSSLRNLIDEALEIIEISVRTTSVIVLTERYGSFAHEDNSIYYNFVNFSDWLNRIHQEADRSRETFIKHYKDTYNGFPRIPFWMAVEIMSFGSLSQLISRLKRSDQVIISKKFNLHHSVFVSWLHTFTYIRNLCAHHSRLWNKELAIELKMPNSASSINISTRKIGSVLYSINQMLKEICVPQSDWFSRLSLLIKENIDGGMLSAMGLPDNWEESLK